MMNEAFERHLREHQFQKQFENAQTLEQRIEFCKSFLKKHNAYPKIDTLPDFYHFQPVVQPSRPDVAVLTAREESARLVYESLGNTVEAERYIKRDLIQKLTQEAIPHIKFEKAADFARDSLIFTAKLGVMKI